MKRVAVLGGGPAGAFAAERLASAGIEAIVLDEKLAWEKPCGGGLTFKAYDRYPFLLHNEAPKRFITDALIGAPAVGAARLSLRQPLVVYSRLDLNRMLLDRASRAGARIEKARVFEATRNGRWKVRTSGGVIEADFCIVATGARNSLRNLGTRLTAADTMRALGYYVPGEQGYVEIQFLPELEGYIWVFPRCGHLSVGVCGKGAAARDLRLRLERFMEDRQISWRDARFYSHLLPSLEAPGWRNNRVAGPGWLAVGDAAGLVDPITGEGIYYALRSAEMAADAIVADCGGWESIPAVYSTTLRADLTADLEFASALAHRIFRGRFLFGAITARTVQFLRYSATFTEVIRDLFDGRQPYRTLKRRLISGLAPTFLEVPAGAALGRVIGLRRPRTPEAFASESV